MYGVFGVSCTVVQIHVKSGHKQRNHSYGTKTFFN